MASERRTDGYGERKANRPILAITPSTQPHATRRWPRAGSKTFGGGCNGSFQAARRARLFLFSIRQHFVDACDDLPRVLDRSLALPDLVQEALTFFLRFFDQRRRRIEWYDLLLVHCPAPDQLPNPRLTLPRAANENLARSRSRLTSFMTCADASPINAR